MMMTVDPLDFICEYFANMSYPKSTSQYFLSKSNPIEFRLGNLDQSNDVYIGTSYMM
jgi:hypothetical protein